MSKRAKFNQLSGQEPAQDRRESLAQMRREQPMTENAPVATDADLSGASLFGAQSQFSLFLVHREHLLDEIKFEKKCLEQLRKDVADWRVFAWPACERGTGRSALPGVTQQISECKVMEQSLLGWLKRLEERLSAVDRDLDVMATQSRSECQGADESLFLLLRAAG